MKFYQCSPRRGWWMLAGLLIILGGSVRPVAARPMPPAVDQLMDPTKPENKLGYKPPTTDAPATNDPFQAPAISFAEFCAKHPTAAQPPGEAPLWIEVLLVDVPVTDLGALPYGTAADNGPTPDMLRQGKLIRQETRTNTCATTTEERRVEHQPNGNNLPEPLQVGLALYTYIAPQVAGGAYDVSLSLHLTILEGWTGYAATKAQTTNPVERSQPVISTRVIDTRLRLSDRWVQVGSQAGETATIGVDGTSQNHRVQHVAYARLMGNEP